MTWDEFKHQNNIHEGRDFYRAALTRVKNLFR